MTEFVIPIGISTKEAKAEIETHLITEEITIIKCYNKQYNWNLFKHFYGSYLLLHLDLFLQLSNFLFDQFFSVLILDSCFLQEWFYIFWYSSILLIKLRMFNISIDSSSLNIFFIFIFTLTANNRKN